MLDFIITAMLLQPLPRLSQTFAPLGARHVQGPESMWPRSRVFGRKCNDWGMGSELKSGRCRCVFLTWTLLSSCRKRVARGSWGSQKQQKTMKKFSVQTAKEKVNLISMLDMTSMYSKNRRNREHCSLSHSRHFLAVWTCQRKCEQICYDVQYMI